MKCRTTSVPVIVVPLIAIGLGAVACSATSSPAPAARPTSASVSSSVSAPLKALPAGGTLPDPCGLVTPAQVATALGRAVGTGKAAGLSAPLAGKSCSWSTVGAPLHDIVISVRSDSTITAAGESVASLFTQDVGAFGAAQELAPVSGIGDKAYIGYATVGADNALVLKHDALMDVVGLYGSDATTPASQARFLALVKAAAANL